MLKQISVIIPTNKELGNIKNLINQINNQKGNFKIFIYVIHQFKNPSIMPVFLKKKNIFYFNLKKNNLSINKISFTQV